jgi:hypothetical protein
MPDRENTETLTALVSKKGTKMIVETVSDLARSHVSTECSHCYVKFCDSVDRTHEVYLLILQVSGRTYLLWVMLHVGNLSAV